MKWPRAEIPVVVAYSALCRSVPTKVPTLVVNVGFLEEPKGRKPLKMPLLVIRADRVGSLGGGSGCSVVAGAG
jgi:hypothetical protein